MISFSSSVFWLFSFFFLIFFQSIRKLATCLEFFLLLSNLLFLYLAMSFNVQAMFGYISLAVFLWVAGYVTFLIPKKKFQFFILGFSIFLVLTFLAIEKYNIFSNIQPLGCIGISYFSFKMISYFCESYYGLINNRSLIRFLNFTFFFPAILSGPIDRYSRFDKEIDAICGGQLPLSSFEFSESLYRIALGAFKIFVISSILFTYTLNYKYLGPAYIISSFDIILGAYAYAFYLYFNFSGYSDMAIGLSNLAGIHLPENFDKPFSATSIQEYWNKWHISLSEWIRDFIFTPLVKFLMKLFPGWNSLFLTSFSICISFLLCGLWHGPELNFLIWGALQGLALTIHMAYKNFMMMNYQEFYKSIKSNNIYIFTSWILTFHFVVFSLLVFGAQYEYLKAIIIQLVN